MIIGFFTDILACIIVMGIVIWMGLLIFRVIINNSKKKKGKKEALKFLNTFEEKFKYVYRMIFMFIGLLVNLIIATILAIGSKPIIFMLNKPLGEGYATFASYIVAICIFIFLPKWFQESKQEKDSHIN